MIVKQKKNILSEKAYYFLRDKIIHGEIKANEMITEHNIASYLGMSRTPVKKAITLLETENYVKSIDGVGTFVIGISIEDLSDLYEVRKVIESLALKTAINNIKSQDIEIMMQKLDDILFKYDNNEIIESSYIADVDDEVHNLILNNSRNNYIKKLFNNIKSQIIRYQYEAYILTDTGKDSTIQHKEILENIMNRNFELAKKSLENHINWSFNVLSQALSNNISID